MSIQDELNKIKNAVYGADVRGAIHDSIKKTYDDASANGNANMEVVMARGTEPTLNDRLGKMDDKDESLTAQLAQTDERVSQTIAHGGDGTIPTELADMRVINGKTYTVAGDALRAIARGEGLSANSVEPETQNFVHFETSNQNLFNGDYTNIWLDVVTKELQSHPSTVSAIVEIAAGEIYRIETQGTHNRFYIGLFDTINIGDTGEILLERLNVTNGSVFEFRSLSDKYLVISLSTMSERPALSVTKKFDKAYLDFGETKEISDYYRNVYVNYETGEIFPNQPTQRALVYPIYRGAEITVETKGAHTRFAVAGGKAENSVVVDLIHKGSADDGMSTGNERFTFTNTTHNFLFINVGTVAVKPSVYVTQRIRKKRELGASGSGDTLGTPYKVDVGITKTKEEFPIMFGVKMSNERDITRGFAERPRPVGWLYYTPNTPYKLLYADGAPENMKYLCDWKTEITWNQISTPEHYRPYITKDGDIIFIWRGDLLGVTTDIVGGRQNPIIYPANDWENPFVVELGDGLKPTSWLQNCGADYLYNKDVFIFAEYTRPHHTNAHVWRVTKPFSNPENWKVTKSFPLSDNSISGMKHCHTINYDTYSDKVFLTTGDDDEASKIFMSSDHGVTWEVVLENSRKFTRLLNFVFTKDKVYWASDDYDHWLFSVNRDVNGVPDFTTINTLHGLNGNPPTYATCLIEEPYGLLLLDRHDGTSDLPLKVHFWDIKGGQMHVIKEINHLEGEPTEWGFRMEAVNWYQAKGDGRIVTGFANPKNKMDILNNGKYYHNKDRVNNLALEVVKEGTGYDLKITAINHRM